MADFTEYPHNYLPQTIQRAAEIIGLTKDGQWSNGAWDSLVSFVDVLRTSAVMNQCCKMCRYQCAWRVGNGWALGEGWIYRRPTYVRWIEAGSRLGVHERDW